MTDTPPAEPEAPAAEGDDNAVIKELRAKAAKADEAEARAAAAERDLAFTKAGIPDEGVGSYFRKGYDGDLTAEAIKAEAAVSGFTTTVIPPTPADPALAGEAQQAASTSAAMAGGDAPGPSGNLGDRAKEIGKDGYGNVREFEAFLADSAPGEAELQEMFGANTR